MSRSKILPAVIPTIDPHQKWLTVDDAAAYLRVSPQTIRAILHRGEIPAARLAPNLGGYHIDRDDLDGWLERKKKIIQPYRTKSRPWVAQRWAKKRKQSAR